MFVLSNLVKKVFLIKKSYLINNAILEHNIPNLILELFIWTSYTFTSFGPAVLCFFCSFKLHPLYGLQLC